MTQYYNRKQFNKEREKLVNNKVNNGLASTLDLPCMPNGQIFDETLYNKVFNRSVHTLLTFNWIGLTNAYNKNSFLQTAVNQKVEDAFRNDGLIIDTKTLDTEELETLRKTMDDEGDLDAIMDCIRWGRLYGGGCLIANTEQDPTLPLDRKQLKGKKLKFLATNRWQCYQNGLSPFDCEFFTFTDAIEGVSIKDKSTTSQIIERSRVGIYTGTKAPYLTRSILQGWNASLFEGIMEPIENLLGGFNVTLELLSEAKIDIFKIANLASTLASGPIGEQQIRKRLQIATANKNYKGSLALDNDDNYEQKQIGFSGIPQLLQQLMYVFCGYLRYPVSKLFGIGSSGFSSGEDDLENYNGTVESEIRIPAKQLITWVVNLRCLQLFGRELPDFRPKWRPLRVMSEKDQAEINSRKLDDYLKLQQNQVMSPRQVAQKLTEDGYILFSDEEIKKLSDEIQENMEQSIREDIEM